MSSEAASVVRTCVPLVVRHVDAATRAAVMEAVRPWVAVTEPKDAQDAQRLLRAGALVALAAFREMGTLDAGVVLHPDTVERLGVRGNADRSVGWRQSTRLHLTRLGRAANPQWWPIQQQRLRRSGIALPYSSDGEQDFLLAADLRCRPGRTAEAAVIVLSLGAGMPGADIALAAPDDVITCGEGRLAVRVRGRNPRLVPVREPYTELAQRLLEAATDGHFFEAVHRNAASCAAGRVPARDGGHLRLRRARNTWLKAHLVAGTDLPALRVLAGPVSAHTLSELLNMFAATVDTEAAVLRG